MDNFVSNVALFLLQILLIKGLVVHTAANQTVLLVNMGDQGVVQSSGFPLRCCESQTITLKLSELQAHSNAFIHLVFTDMDLPVGTNFKIYSKQNEEAQNMFRTQPDYKHGMWQRPFITSTRDGQLIHLILKPPRDDDYKPEFYGGFKASYTVTRDEKPYYSMTSDLCPSIASLLEGDLVTVKPSLMASYSGKWIDCVWHLKTPTYPTSSTSPTLNTDDQFRAYIRIISANLNRGLLQIHRGHMSTSPKMVTGKTLVDLRQPLEGFTGPQGFYIHIFMPADNRDNKFSFIYGVMYYLSSVEDSCDAGFKCPNNPSWCVPTRNICNKVDNCPDGAEEIDCQKTSRGQNTLAPVTMPPTATPVPSFTPKDCFPFFTCSNGKCAILESYCDSMIGMYGCSSTSKSCPDGSCVFSFDTCPGECTAYQKKCNNGECLAQKYTCPEESCPTNDPHRCEDNRGCYSESDRCDDYNDCMDASDEEACFTYDKNKFFLLFGVALPVFCLSIVYKRIRAVKRRRREAAQEHTGTRMHAVTNIGNTSPTLTSHGYTAVNTDYTPTSLVMPDISNHVDDDRVEPAVPPPSYEEVLGTNDYPPTQEPPPPSYDTAIRGPRVHIL